MHRSKPHALGNTRSLPARHPPVLPVSRAISAHYGVTPVPAHVTWSEDPTLGELRRGIRDAKNVSETGAISYQAHTHFTASRAALMRAATVGQRPLLLFTSLRHPVSRLHSGYVQVSCQEVVRRSNPSTDPVAMITTQCGGLGGGNATVLDMVRQNDTLASRWAFATLKKGNENYVAVKGQARTPQEVFDMYDFIFVQERMAESVVAFMLEYGLTWQDVLQLPAKKRTGKFRSYADARELNDYILSKNKKELELWQLAN